MVPEWEKVEGPLGGNGCYTDRLKVPGGWIYKVEEWGTGGLDGELLNRCVVFVPQVRRKE